MARALRVQYSDAIYHVMNRGNNHQNIFSSDKDYSRFLALLEDACAKLEVRVGAYCLMPNHYHLVIRTPKGNLADFMKRLNALYAQKLNYLRGWDGHLFQGRYKAILIEVQRYLMSVIRYIHLNPVKAGIVHQTSDYPYSSHNLYLDQKITNWFEGRRVLSMLFPDHPMPMDAYRRFMNEPIENELLHFYMKKRQGWILGTPQFKEALLGSDPRV